MSPTDGLEQRLRAGLEEAAQHHLVDLHTLHGATRERLADASTSSRRRRLRAVALLAAAAVVVAGATFVVTGVVDRSSSLVTSDGSASAVDDDFTCPSQVTIEHATSSDDSFIPQLSAAGRPAGEAAGAPTYEVVIDGDTAELRRGNADGTLASRTRFGETDAGYEPITTVTCSNAAGGPADDADLAAVQEGLPPASPQAFNFDDFAPGAVKVIDRMTYDASGLATRRTTWAEPCAAGVCLTSGSRDTTILTARLRGDAARPHDETSLLFRPRRRRGATHRPAPGSPVRPRRGPLGAVARHRRQRDRSGAGGGHGMDGRVLPVPGSRRHARLRHGASEGRQPGDVRRHRRRLRPGHPDQRLLRPLSGCRRLPSAGTTDQGRQKSSSNPTAPLTPTW